MSGPIALEWVDHLLGEIVRTLRVEDGRAELTVLDDAGPHPEIGRFATPVSDVDVAMVAGLESGERTHADLSVSVRRTGEATGSAIRVTDALDALVASVGRHAVGTARMDVSYTAGHVGIALTNRGAEPVTFLLQPHRCRWIGDDPDWSTAGVVLPGFRADDRAFADGIDLPATIAPGTSLRTHIPAESAAGVGPVGVELAGVIALPDAEDDPFPTTPWRLRADPATVSR